MNDKTTQLKKIKDDIINLTQSPLYSYRKKNNYVPVIGQGNHDASIMFIGEAPGKNEAQTGRPFCGAAGRVLDELFLSIHLKREDVYITNIVKDRPPENRDPTKKEIDIYTPFLIKQIDIIQPSIIATLGRFAMTFILETFHCPEKIHTIGTNHGKTIQAQSSYGTIWIVPLYHPAVALYNDNTKKILSADMKILQTLNK